ncbi:membrane protein insertase YidC [Eggerthella sinensis]|uniref:membrane protein insertase YidC n=1 Tax=Eggerthella sinensis TaxID=242230 RepID=UPI00248D89E7|nr:membrane protein insertase YidC [Eggerthella sinensis]
MLEALAHLFSYIVQPCYDLTGSWWMAILLFTVIIKIVLMPLSLWCQWNSIVMVKIMPELNRIKVKYFGDAETIGEKQTLLNKKHHYHPLLSLIPLAVQIIVLFGLVEVIHGITDHGAPGTEFLGMVPVEDGGLSWIMPLLAGLSAVIMGFAQNRINPLQREQSKMEKNTTNGLSIVLSLVLGVYVAAGMAFYWICSNLMSIIVQALCNLIIRPSKYIDYTELAASRMELDELNAFTARKTPWYKRDPLAKREKEDYKRFMSVVGKHIVFYSERSGFYKYFEGALEWLLANSDVNIHYVTSDPNDQVFELQKSKPRLVAYYIGDKRLITLMMKLDCDVAVMTLDDLENFYIKRSYIRKDIEYVYTFHHMTSTHLVSAKEALDHYDTILCVGPHQKWELERAEEMRGLPARNLVECGYDLLDRQIAAYASRETPETKRPVVLVAPSWQEDCLLDLCADEVIKPLLGRGYSVIVRPHPEYTKRYHARWESLQQRYASWSRDDIYFEQDFSTSDSVYDADVLITDWSSIACEFSFTTMKPSIFVDTPMKVSNPDWEELGIEPTDISIRNQIGVSLAVEELERLGDVVEDMVLHPETWQNRIEEVRSHMIYHQGHGGETAGAYLLERMLAKQGGSADEAFEVVSHGE